MTDEKKPKQDKKLSLHPLNFVRARSNVRQAPG